MQEENKKIELVFSESNLEEDSKFVRKGPGGKVLEQLSASMHSPIAYPLSVFFFLHRTSEAYTINSELAESQLFSLLRHRLVSPLSIRKFEEQMCHLLN
jgi:hypothetical protein